MGPQSVGAPYRGARRLFAAIPSAHRRITNQTPVETHVQAEPGVPYPLAGVPVAIRLADRVPGVFAAGLVLEKYWSTLAPVLPLR
jgi:hypothetical protein